MKTIALLILLALMMPTQWTIAQKNAASTHLLHLSFKPTFNNKTLNANTWYISEQGDSIKIELIKLYISNIEVYNQNKSVFKEPNSYHLLNSNEPNSFKIDIPVTTTKNISHIAFNVGIDSVTSMSGALEGDLDPAKGMYWAWQSGYINFKLEGKCNNCPTRNHAFEFHLGGYQAPFNCLKTIFLKAANQKNIVVVFDLNQFLSTFDLSTQNQIMSPSKTAVLLSEQAIKSFKIISP